MKAEIKIPKGWRILDFGDAIHEGDRWRNPHSGRWMDTAWAGNQPVPAGAAYIRRIPRPKARRSEAKPEQRSKSKSQGSQADHQGGTR